MVIDPVTKRYLMGIDPDLIKEVFGINQVELRKTVNDYCKSANPEAYKELKTGNKQPDLRILKANAERFRK